MKIAVDFHGVTADLHEYVRKYIKNIHGVTLTDEDCKAWKIWDVAPIKKEWFWNAVDDVNNNDGTVLLNPVKNSPFYLYRLSCFYDCEILTAVPDSVKSDVCEWLKNHGCGHIKVNTIGVKKAHGEIKFTYPFDIYIDDNPYMVGQTPENKFLILFDQPWNRSVKVNDRNEFRAIDWEEVISLCHSIQQKL